MNMSTSECSSGCESGWTMYLDQSLSSEDGKCYKGGYNGKWPCVSHVEQEEGEEEEEEEDLSMVSDASSGPRQKLEEDEESKHGYNYGSQERRKTRLNKDVDDTASSPSSTCNSKKKSGLLKKASSVAEKCALNKTGAKKEVKNEKRL